MIQIGKVILNFKFLVSEFTISPLFVSLLLSRGERRSNCSSVEAEYAAPDGGLIFGGMLTRSLPLTRPFGPQLRWFRPLACDFRAAQHAFTSPVRRDIIGRFPFKMSFGNC